MRIFRPIFRLSLLLLPLLSQACVHVHRIDVQQGNVIAPEALEQLRPGLSRRQVTYLLGTPLVQDPFHPDRYDYLFFRHTHTPVETTERHRLTLHFEKGLLARAEGDQAPADFSQRKAE